MIKFADIMFVIITIIRLILTLAVVYFIVFGWNEIDKNQFSALLPSAVVTTIFYFACYNKKLLN